MSGQNDEPTFERNALLNKPGIVGARWWNRSLAAQQSEDATVNRRGAMVAMFQMSELLNELPSGIKQHVLIPLRTATERGVPPPPPSRTQRVLDVPASGPRPGRPATPGPTYRDFLRLAVGVMLVLGREALEAHELAVASLTAAQAAGSASPGVAAPSPVPTEGEVPPPTPPTPTSKVGQADAVGGQGVGQRWSFAAAISAAERARAAAGRWAEAVDGAWHGLAWPLPREATSPADMDPPLGGDMLIEPGRPSQTDETRWLQGPTSEPAAVRRVQPRGGVGYVAPRIATRSWLAAHVKHSNAGPRGPPRRRPRHHRRLRPSRPRPEA